MFKRRQNETQEEFDKRMDRRMELLFPTMTQEIKKPKLHTVQSDTVFNNINFKTHIKSNHR